MNLFIAPFVNALFGVYYWVGNFGLAIILVTLVIKVILLPLIWPSLKSAKKTQEIQPKLNKLKEKFGNNKQALAQAQMELYKQEGINPLGGCLPSILQIVVLMLFFSAFNMVTNFSQGQVSRDLVNAQLVPSFRVEEGFKFDLGFLGSDLATTPAKVFGKGITLDLVLPIILLLGSAGLQYLSAKLMMPNTKVDEKIVEKTKDKEDDMMAAMRTQSLYMMPAMTVFIGWNFSLGLLLYWFISSVLAIGQQLLVNKFNKK